MDISPTSSSSAPMAVGIPEEINPTIPSLSSDSPSPESHGSSLDSVATSAASVAAENIPDAQLTQAASSSHANPVEEDSGMSDSNHPMHATPEFHMAPSVFGLSGIGESESASSTDQTDSTSAREAQLQHIQSLQGRVLHMQSQTSSISAGIRGAAESWLRTTNHSLARMIGHLSSVGSNESSTLPVPPESDGEWEDWSPASNTHGTFTGHTGPTGNTGNTGTQPSPSVASQVDFLISFPPSSSFSSSSSSAADAQDRRPLFGRMLILSDSGSSLGANTAAYPNSSDLSLDTVNFSSLSSADLISAQILAGNQRASRTLQEREAVLSSLEDDVSRTLQALRHPGPWERSYHRSTPLRWPARPSGQSASSSTSQASELDGLQEMGFMVSPTSLPRVIENLQGLCADEKLKSFDYSFFFQKSTPEEEVRGN